MSSGNNKRRRTAQRRAVVLATRLWTEILTFLGPSVWTNAAEVCKQLQSASSVDVLWMPVFRRIQNTPPESPPLGFIRGSRSLPDLLSAMPTIKEDLLKLFTFCPGCDVPIPRRCLVRISDVCGMAAHEEFEGCSGPLQLQFTKFERDQCHYFSHDLVSYWRAKCAVESRYATLKGVWGRPVCYKCAGEPSQASIMSMSAVASHCHVSVKRLTASKLPRFMVGRCTYFAVSHVRALANE